MLIHEEQLQSFDVPTQSCVPPQAPSELVVAIKNGEIDRASEIARELLSRPDDLDAMVELANGYFVGPLPTPASGDDDRLRAYRALFQEVQERAYALIESGSLGDERRGARLGPRALELLARAEESPRDPPELKARAMAALSSASPARTGPARGPLLDKDAFVAALTKGDPARRLAEGGVSDQIFQEAEKGPVRVSDKGVQVFKEGKLPLQNYELTRVIGHGISGNVALAKHRPAGGGEPEMVVVKKIALSPGEERKQVDTILRETAIQMHLFGASDRPYVCEIKKAIVCKNELYIVLDPADSSLESYLQKNRGKVTKDQLLGMFHDLAGSYGQMHQSGYLHKDIKADNVLKKGDKLLVSDFGLSEPIDKPGLTAADQAKRIKDDNRSFAMMMLGAMDDLPEGQLTPAERRTLGSLKSDFGMFAPSKIESYRPPRNPTTVDRVAEVARDLVTDSPANPMDAGKMTRAQDKLWQARTRGLLDRIAEG
jgi:hypothetical protein